jgi:hypothetical protein
MPGSCTTDGDHAILFVETALRTLDGDTPFVDLAESTDSGDSTDGAAEAQSSPLAMRDFSVY